MEQQEKRRRVVAWVGGNGTPHEAKDLEGLRRTYGDTCNFSLIARVKAGIPMRFPCDNPQSGSLP